MAPDVVRAYLAGAPDEITARDRAVAQDALEGGTIAYLPRLGFELGTGARFLSERWSDGKSKNISLRAGAAQVRGAAGGPSDLAELAALLERFATHSECLVRSLLPGYVGRLRRASTSLRPFEITSRKSTWRKDDTRLHVDSFPSNPTGGVRLLRVFCNVNPWGVPRVWRIGEPFAHFAQRFHARMRRPRPWLAGALHVLGVTKQKRSPYDHLMLQLHDGAKADAAYQREAPQRAFAFPAGATWMVFTDQVLHAAMSGQHAFEQTFLLDPAGLANPEHSPLRVLERLTGTSLLPACATA
jgi:hypothetical protein